MVALNFARATTAGLMMVNSRITDPAMTPTVFNNWYSNVHLQDMVSNNFATVALRYSNYTVNSGPPASPPAFPLSTNYLALYDVPDLSFLFNPSTAAALPLTDPTFPDPTQLIFTWSAWIFTFWVPTQVYEGLIPGFGRPKYVLVEKIEPAAGGDADLDKWYRTEVRSNNDRDGIHALMIPIASALALFAPYIPTLNPVHILRRVQA